MGSRNLGVGIIGIFKDMRVGILKFSVLGLRSLGAGNVEIRTHLSLC